MRIQNLIFFVIFSFLISCSNQPPDKIELNKEEVAELEKSMRFVRNTLVKSSFDTVAVKEFILQRELYPAQVFGQLDKINGDSIKRNINDNFESYLPLTKEIYQFYDGSVVFNDRFAGNSMKEFKNFIENCDELKELTGIEKQKFIDSFIVLTKNNIWGCQEEGANKFYFPFSKNNLDYGSTQARYLYLEEDIGQDLLEYKVLLDRKNGITLFKPKPR